MRAVAANQHARHRATAKTRGDSGKAGVQAMAQVEGTVFVVDDDAGVRRSLERLLRSGGWNVRAFASADEFLQSGRPEPPACLVLDVQMPGQTGLELQDSLHNADIDIPIIFISGHAQVPMAIRAMRGGAINFLPKPFTDGELVQAIEEGMAMDRERLVRSREIERIRQHMQRLTPRQREVMGMVIRGMLNKQIARALGIAEKTVKVHRAQMMEVMGVTSVAELVRAVVIADPDVSTATEAEPTSPD